MCDAVWFVVAVGGVTVLLLAVGSSALVLWLLGAVP